MRKVVYAKYNRTRMPRYQTGTKIIKDEELLYVVKDAVNDEAIDHIMAFEHRKELLDNLYVNAAPISVVVENDIARFEYIEGVTASEYLFRDSNNWEQFLFQLKKMTEYLLQVASDEIVMFESSKEFVEIFGEYESPKGCLAVKGGDIDLIFDNFILRDDKWYIIDYEWTYDFLIPLNFIKFRTLYYFYYKNYSYFIQHMNIDEYLEEFGINKVEKEKFIRMDDHFQMSVHGENRKYIYTNNYCKKQHDITQAMYDNIELENMPELIRQKDAVETELRIKETEISIKNQEVIERTQEISIKNQEIEDMGKEMNQLHSTIGSLNDRVAELQRWVMERDNKVFQLDKAYNEYKTQYDDIMHSVSWRMTKPLRLAIGLPKCVAEHGMAYTMHYIMTGKGYTIENPIDFVEKYEYDRVLLAEQRNTRFTRMVKISILVPLYNTPENFLREMIESVVQQTYTKWELCLADGSDSDHAYVGTICKEYCRADKRVKYKVLKENKGISENTNACMKMAKGDYIALFDHDDVLDLRALYEIVKRINEKADTDVVYTDEDKMMYDTNTQKWDFVEPHHKSDFNLDLLRSNNYICHFFVVNRNIVKKIGGFRSEYDGSQDYDFIFRCVEKAKNIEHIPNILYHWRIHANSTAADPRSKMYCYEAGQHAIEAHLKRMGVTGQVQMLEHLGFYHVKYPVEGEPLVSIIIPNKDEMLTLKKCIESIESKTTYTNYEIIVVENNSKTDEIFKYYKELESDPKIKVVTWKHEFNYSKINNFGIQQAMGDYLLLLNNDVEVIKGEWLEEMLGNCQRKEVGAVGAKLIYPDDTVQHAGVIIGLGGIAGHAFVGLNAEHPGYFGRAFVQQNLSAVTAACLMVRKDVYNEVGGLEEELQVAFNDVDFCLKIRQCGYLIVMNPNVLLYHYESKSRGAEDTPEKQARFQKEVQYMERHWYAILKDGDPYYNPNLTLCRGDFSLKSPEEAR